MKSFVTFVLAAVCAIPGSFAAAQGAASTHQAYPSRPIRLIISSAPGGQTDISARTLAPRWSELMGQLIVMDNRAGAAGVIGSEMVAKAAPDGYTLLWAFSGPMVIVPQLGQPTPYDTLKDFAPVCLAVSAPYVLLVNPRLAVKSVKELVALAKAKPGKMNYASGGTGGGMHLAGELFNLAAGVQIMHVPYKGGAPGMTAVLAGEVDMMFNGLAMALPHIKADKVRALAVGSEKRFPLLPDLPTVIESGFQFNTSGWYGVLAPRSTPRAIVTRLQGALVQVVNAQQMKDHLLDTAIEPIGSTPEQFGALLRDEMTMWGKVIKAANLKGM